ncbi:MAG: thioredoxin [Spirochaetes bacterium]|nr:thioredoxin [Spirochaetota bacterium]
MNLPNSFEQLIQTSEKPILVDFWADWCGPCKLMSPIIAEIAKEYKDKVLVIKINVDQKQSLAAKYQIQSIPTIMLFKNGHEVIRLPGARAKTALLNELSPFIS